MSNDEIVIRKSVVKKILEVIGRGSPDFIRLQDICANPLIHEPATFNLVCIAHHLGDL